MDENSKRNNKRTTIDKRDGKTLRRKEINGLKYLDRKQGEQHKKATKPEHTFYRLIYVKTREFRNLSYLLGQLQIIQCTLKLCSAHYNRLSFFLSSLNDRRYKIINLFCKNLLNHFWELNNSLISCTKSVHIEKTTYNKSNNVSR